MMFYTEHDCPYLPYLPELNGSKSKDKELKRVIEFYI